MGVDMYLENKLALVTGASRGIGAAIAKELGNRGAMVVGTATTEAGAERITEAFKAEGVKGQGVCLDITDNAAIERVLKMIGAPEILVNNAGITRDNLMLRMKPEEWDDVINTNLSAVYRLTKACLRPMIKARSGRIISISSVVGATGNAGQANYAAAKAGVVGFSKSLAKEVATRGVTVNIVAPGFIETDMTKALSDEQREGILGAIPMKLIGAPSDIAHAVAFLASPYASYITGETLHVNGGMLMS